MKLSWFLVMGVVLGLARPGAAGVLSIDFELSRSTLVIVGDDSQPTQVSVEPGSLTLTLGGVNAAGMILTSDTDGSLSNLLFNTTIVTQLDATTTLTRSFELTAPSTQGMFDGAQLTFAPGLLRGNLFFASACTGSSCASLFPFTFPEGIRFPFANVDLVSFALTGIGSPGSATLRGSAPLNSINDPTPELELRLEGREIARRFDAPEPGEAGLVLLAVAALGGRALGRRARRRTAPTSDLDPRR